ncbi:hypothetical protein D0962_23085 [Leptolyngbyaceae cyanobacterium CCMR0082]|uniref:Uncharacterized protein n=1 Tax=Adonisia turfae CCMR0082 TaxID=2304604 RepID=A0A6M0SAS3_9CYAN|nr:hypothetical protein [Adonisia turfae]NEZ65605.1 hypothetical protein [Adonisia turfae CCMR0082]
MKNKATVKIDESLNAQCLRIARESNHGSLRAVVASLLTAYAKSPIEFMQVASSIIADIPYRGGGNRRESELDVSPGNPFSGLYKNLNEE